MSSMWRYLVWSKSHVLQILTLKVNYVNLSVFLKEDFWSFSAFLESKINFYFKKDK